MKAEMLITELSKYVDESKFEKIVMSSKMVSEKPMSDDDLERFAYFSLTEQVNYFIENYCTEDELLELFSVEKAIHEEPNLLKKELIYLESQVKRVKMQMEEENQNGLELQPLLDIYEDAVKDLKEKIPEKA
jgi:hypothetical protein